jgi:hypothetical protein
VRTFLLSIFWITNVGNVIQLLIMVSAGLILYSDSYSFSELSVNVFITQFVPWLIWLKAFIISLLGEFGRWLLEIPILVIAPLKFIAGTVIGLWAYSLAKEMPVEPVPTQHHLGNNCRVILA